MSTAPSQRGSGRATPLIGTIGGRRASSIGSSFDNRGTKGRERATIQQRLVYNDTLTNVAGENRSDSKDVPNSSYAIGRRSSAFPNSKSSLVSLTSTVKSPIGSFARISTQATSSPIDNFPNSSPHLSGDFQSRSTGSRTSSLNLHSSKEVSFVQKRTRPSLPFVVPSFFSFRKQKTAKTTSISSQSTHEEEEESASMSQRMEDDERNDRKTGSSAHLSSYPHSPSTNIRPSLLRKSETAPYSVSPGTSPALSSKVFNESPHQFFPNSPSSFKQGSNLQLIGSPHSYLDVPRAASPSNMHAHLSPLVMPRNSARIGDDGHSHNVSLTSSPSDKLHCQKSFESHDSTTSAMSMLSTSPDDQETNLTNDRRLRRAHTESRKNQKHSRVNDESSSSSNQNPSSSTHSQEPLRRQMLLVWKKAIGSLKGAQKTKTEAVQSSVAPPPPIETDASTDALYQFLRCRQCSKGEKCNDPNCPGRDPNKLPTITKHDLGAEQRRALLKKANPRLHSLDAP